MEVTIDIKDHGRPEFEAMVNFARALMHYAYKHGEGWSECKVKLVFVGQEQIRTPPPDNMGLERTTFAVSNPVNGVVVHVTLNTPVDTADQFFTLGENMNKVSPREVFKMLFG